MSVSLCLSLCVCLLTLCVCMFARTCAFVCLTLSVLVYPHIAHHSSGLCVDIHVSIGLSTCNSVLCVLLSVSLSVSMELSLYASVSLYICLSPSLYMPLLFSLCICLAVYLSLCIGLSMYRSLYVCVWTNVTKRSASAIGECKLFF